MFTRLPFPADVDNKAGGISSGGLIVGQYSDAAGIHAFVDDGGNIRTINAQVAGVTITRGRGINAGDEVVGSYSNAAGSHGFSDDRGAFDAFDVPGAGNTNTQAYGINNARTIVGTYLDAAGATRGFLRDPRGFFMAFSPPRSPGHPPCCSSPRPSPASRRERATDVRHRRSRGAWPLALTRDPRRDPSL